MPRFRTAAVATLLVIPIVAGGFLLQEPPVRANALLFDQVLSLVQRQYVDTVPADAMYEKAARGLVRELNDPYSELLSPKAIRGLQSHAPAAATAARACCSAEQSQGRDRRRSRFSEHARRRGRRSRRRSHHRGRQRSTSTARRSTRCRTACAATPARRSTVVYARPGVDRADQAPVHAPRSCTCRRLQFTGDRSAITSATSRSRRSTRTRRKKCRGGRRAVKQGAKGIVLDMRDNGGGIVEQALETASLFLQAGPGDRQRSLAQSANRDRCARAGRHSRRHDSARRARRRRLGVGDGDRRRRAAGPRPRARPRHDVVRQRTRAVGVSLNGGYNLKLTTGKWYTPSGRSIHRERKLMPNGAVRRSASRFARGATDAASDVQVRRRSRGVRRRRNPPRRDRQRRHALDGRAQLPPRGRERRSRRSTRVLQDYALELKGTVAKGFAPPAAWTPELMRRSHVCEVKIDPKFDATARAFLVARPGESGHAAVLR